MNVFVTGGTGVLGRPVVRQLVAAGHSVRGLARSEAAVEMLRTLGAEPVRADLFDPASLSAALAGTDTVLHLATRIPDLASARKREAWRENDRIRREGTRNLVDAALAAGAQTFIYPSVVLVYADGGDGWLDAATATRTPAFSILESTLAAEAEVARFTEGGGRGIVLRMGQFYGHDRFTGALLVAARRGIGLLPGDLDAFLAPIWIDDAATAVTAALAPQVPAGTYDVVDDEPLRRREVLDALARAAGRRRLRRIPGVISRPLAGAAGGVSALSLRVSNQRFRDVSGWAPAVPNAREGIQRLAAESAAPARPSRRVRAVRQARIWLAVLVAVALPVALWQLLAPQSFYNDFPGLGRQWVSGDGPFNEHLMRDVGGLGLGLAAVAIVALVWTTAATVRAAAAGTLAAAVPHFIYHVVHLDRLPSTSDQVIQTVALTVGPLIALMLLRVAGRLAAAEAPVRIQMVVTPSVGGIRTSDAAR